LTRFFDAEICKAPPQAGRDVGGLQPDEIPERSG